MTEKAPLAFSGQDSGMSARDSFNPELPSTKNSEPYLTWKSLTRPLNLTIPFCQQQSEMKYLRSINRNKNGFNPLLLRLTEFKNNTTEYLDKL